VKSCSRFANPTLNRLSWSLFVTVIFISAVNARDWWPFGEKNPQSTVPVIIDAKPISAETKRATSYSDVVKSVSPNVVKIIAKQHVQRGRSASPFFFDDPLFRRFFEDRFGENFDRPDRQDFVPSMGSGVIVSGDGYLLTNAHVVKDADDITISFAGGKKEYTARLVGADTKTDIAVIKVDAKLPAITLGDSDTLEVGDAVLAIGNPFGVGQTVTSGIVSAIDRGGMGITDYEDFIQTDASINPGNSGGALVDAEGRLVGINTAILSRSGGNQGIGFAVPINLARSVMEQLLTNGRVSRGFLGVNIQDIDAAIADHFKLTVTEGVLVTDVTDGGAAKAAGVQREDVIIAYEGKAITDARELRLAVAGTPPGSKTRIKVLRKGKEVALRPVLKELPGAREVANSGTEQQNDGDDVLRGIVVDDIDQATRQRIQDRELQGAIVLRINPSSPAAQSSLQPGDIILEINRKRVRNADEAIAAAQEADGTSALLYVWSRGGGRYVVVKDK
jgi:serine protease Do